MDRVYYLLNVPCENMNLRRSKDFEVCVEFSSDDSFEQHDNSYYDCISHLFEDWLAENGYGEGWYPCDMIEPIREVDCYYTNNPLVAGEVDARWM